MFTLNIRPHGGKCVLKQAYGLPGQSEETGPPQLVVAMLGDDIILPCQLEPPKNAVSMTMEWGRHDLEPRFVLVWHDGQELLTDQNKAYKGRASVSINNLTLGDFSLRLSSVKISDNGKYRCYFPKLNKKYFVELIVGRYTDYTVLHIKLF